MKELNWEKLNTTEFINLEETLFSGQVFQFKKMGGNIYMGVLSGNVITLKQEKNDVFFVNDSDFIKETVENFFNLDIKIKTNKNGLRFLTNDLYPTIFSFICSSNNNIQRITRMVDYLYSKGNILSTMNKTEYVQKLDSDKNEGCTSFYSFPELKKLINIEKELISEKFGYRASYICQAANFLLKNQINWHNLSYYEAREKLMKIKGIGKKVADCICLIGLKHFQSVPIDTHIFKYSIEFFKLPIKTLSNKNYDIIQKMWIEKYGKYAGIMQLYAFKTYLDVRINKNK